MSTNTRTSHRSRVATIAVGAATVLALSGSAYAIGTTSPVSRSAPATSTSERLAPAPPLCHQLGARLGRLGGAAGTSYQAVRVTNRSAHRCRVGGSARVAFSNRHHIMVGWPAAAAANPRTVVLSPGRSTRFAVAIPNPGNFPRIDCIPHNAHLLRVRMGADPTPSTLRLDQVACMTRHGRAFVTAYGF